MTKRVMIKIDESRCDGCGLCVTSCAEGALQIVDGKARLISDRYCDGLGACLGECPQGALTIEEREADEFNPSAVSAQVQAHSHSVAPSGHGCPGAKAVALPKKGTESAACTRATKSELTQWPVQFHLVPVSAPYLQGADLLVTADCVPFAMGDYHERYLAGRAVLVGCPKLDQTDSYIGKLSEIIRHNGLKSLTVLIMEVPCCRGLAQIVQAAVAQSGVNLPVREVVVSLQGEVKEKASPCASCAR